MSKKLIAIIILALVLRFYGIDWDKGFHLHPDERMLIMVADKIHFFDKLNPNFFNYGSLPVYLLKGLSQFFSTTDYSGMLYVGRYLSIFFDLATVLFIFKISHLLFKKESIALFSSFLYAVSFFPIQNSHFFTVDIMLTLLTTLLLYILLKYLPLPSRIRPLHRWYYPLIIGVVFAAMLATKITAIIFLPIIVIAILLAAKFTKYSILNTIYFILISLVAFFIFMPYAFLDYQEFIRQTFQQVKMNGNPYIFPYTLQYVDTIPYLYYLRNIFLWGLGPIISMLVLLGMFMFRVKRLRNSYRLRFDELRHRFTKLASLPFILFIFFYLFYFLIIGRSSVKFMRYMLPIYPFLAILAGYGMNSILSSRPKWIPRLRFAALGMTGVLIWTLFFISIYSQPNTRITATDWILNNIPPGKTLAIEHWDDKLPLYNSEKYNFVEMTLYEQPDDDYKWENLKKKLQRADYIVIASNRLYIPLQKLSDCAKYKVCYPKTAQYYQQLFSGNLGFRKVVEFEVYPRLEIGNWKLEIRDAVADESFTVYDHPKIMIFKKS